MEIADAVTSDGWILGRRMLTLHDSGAYARFSPYGVTKHAFHHSGAYTIPNLRFDGFVCFTNRVPTTAMRGFGVTSVSFAVETHLTRIASVLGLDPWQLRLRNANRDRRHERQRRRAARPVHGPGHAGRRGARRRRAAGRVPADDAPRRAPATSCPSISSRSSALNGEEG